MQYLNKINYAGINLWALPNIANDFNRLYYGSLNALAYPGSNGYDYGILHDGGINSIGNVGPFINVANYAYWSSSQLSLAAKSAWAFDTITGNSIPSTKPSRLFAWAVYTEPAVIFPPPPGPLLPTPISGSVWLFGTGLLGLIGLRQRKHFKQ